MLAQGVVVQLLEAGLQVLQELLLGCDDSEGLTVLDRKYALANLGLVRGRHELALDCHPDGVASYYLQKYHSERPNVKTPASGGILQLNGCLWLSTWSLANLLKVVDDFRWKILWSCGCDLHAVIELEA